MTRASLLNSVTQCSVTVEKLYNVQNSCEYRLVSWPTFLNQSKNYFVMISESLSSETSQSKIYLTLKDTLNTGWYLEPHFSSNQKIISSDARRDVRMNIQTCEWNFQTCTNLPKFRKNLLRMNPRFMCNRTYEYRRTKVP